MDMRNKSILFVKRPIVLSNRLPEVTRQRVSVSGCSVGIVKPSRRYLVFPNSLPYRRQPAVGAAGGEEGGAAHRGGRQPEPRVPAHPRPARVPLGRLQGRPGRRQRRHQGEQGEAFFCFIFIFYFKHRTVSTSFTAILQIS